MPRTPMLKALLPLVLLAACPWAAAQPREDANDEWPGRNSPEAVVSRTERAAGRSAIPQPGEGFPKALAFETEAPLKIPFVREGQVVPWQQAANYLGGDVIVVEGRIEDAFQVPNGPCLLKFDAKNREAFYLAAFVDGWADLKDPPAELYRGKTVRVSGAVTDYRGNPQMIVNDPAQIEIVKAGR